jgi:branched-chain amino acid transport system ATP-binding protein
MIRVESLIVNYEGTQVLKGLSFDATKGTVNLIVGENGSGKSTLLRTLAGAITPQAGRVVYKGRDILRLSRRERLLAGIVYVKQKNNVFPDLSVLDNLKVACYVAGKTDQYRQTLVKIVELFPVLTARSSQKAGSLSGGEKQQLAIGMGIIQCPEVLLVDEPSIGLAPKAVNDVLLKISDLSNSFGVTTVLVEQNLRSAIRIADNVCLLSGGIVKERIDTDKRAEEELLKTIYSGLTNPAGGSERWTALKR